MSSERLERLTRSLDSYAARDELPGGVVMIGRHGRIAYLHSFGWLDREAGIAMREDAIFRIASQTKAIIAIGILILLEQGRLLLSDPVEKFLPEFARTSVAVPGEGAVAYEIVPRERPITIRDLLTHTAGLGYGGGPAADAWKAAGIAGWYFGDRDEPILATVSRMARLPFDAQPGERWIYGYSYDVLGAVIEQASGQELDRFLEQHVFDPLRMHDTHFYLPSSKVDRLATVYSSSEGGGLERAAGTSSIGQGHYVDGPRRSFSGGSGLLSTVHDYGRLYQMLLNGGELEGTRILSPKTVELMTVDHVQQDRNGQGFGLGFYVVEDLGARGTLGSVGEFGWGGAYNTTGWADPQEDLFVVYMTQIIPKGDVDDLQKVRSLVYQAVMR
ncbi:MAG: serine hydrolase domain-containing protein [Gemmatimonadota bacterium]